MFEKHSKCYNSPTNGQCLPSKLGRNFRGHIPSCPRHVRHDAVAMATAAAYRRRIEHSAVMGVWKPNA